MSSNFYLVFIIMTFNPLVLSISSQQISMEIFKRQMGNPYALNMNIDDLRSFQVFKIIERKFYSTPEEQTYRLLVYQENLKLVNKHNTQALNQLNTGATLPVNDINPVQNTKYKMKLNKFADLSELQFRKTYTMTYPTTQSVKRKVELLLNKNKISSDQQNQKCSCQSTTVNIQNSLQQLRLDADIKNYVENLQTSKITEYNSLLNKTQQINQINSADQTSDNLTQSNTRNLQTVQTNNIIVDWTKNAGAVKFQGNCGSCYAFAAVDVVSALNSIFKFGLFVPLSIQQIIDCTNNGLAYGCNGGFMEGAFTQIQTQGITTDFAYKYTAKKSEICQIATGSFKISSFKNIVLSCMTIIQELKNKPLAIAIAAFRLRFYSSGVFDDCNEFIDHAVVLIGYTSGVGWKIKNSWGPDWGMKGYAWIKDGNNCGICTNAIVATIPEELPKI